MVTPNLPSLDKKSSRILPFDKAGAWTRLKSLDDLAKSLEIQSTQMDAAQLKSVPDPWGHITAFRDALFAVGDTHPAHRSAVQIWRALLAILGLRAFQNRVTLRTQMIDLGTEGADGPAGRLGAIARRFAPAESFDARVGWEKLWLVLASVGAEDELVGLVSPLTLIAPARGIRDGLLRELAGKLEDFGTPLGRSLYTPEQLRALQQFVGNLADTIRAVSPGSGRLMELLSEYQKDLGQAGANEAYPQPREETRPLGNLPPATALIALDKVWRPGEVQEAASDCEIIVSENFKRVFAGAVLADDTIGTTLGRPSDRVVLWRGWRLSALADNMGAIRADAHKYQTRGYVVITSDDLFSPILTPFESANIAAHGAGELAQMLLPVTPLALLLWTVKELQDRLTVRSDGPDCWIAELKLTLTGKDGKRYDHVLRRAYQAPSAKRGGTASLALVEGTVRMDAPAALAAWPNFSGPQWRWNFFYFNAEYNQATMPTSGLSPQMLVKDLNGEADCTARWARILEWASPAGPWSTPSTRKLDDDRRSWFERIRFSKKDPAQREGSEQELQRCDYSFEAVSFAVMDPSFVLHESKLGSQFAGIGLLQPSVVAPQLNEVAAEVATDFGTTNTTIYAKFGGQQHELHFSPRLRLFNTGKRDPNSEFDSYSTFLPLTEIVPPFTTVMRGRVFNLRDDDKEALINKAKDPALWRDYIFFDKNIAVTMSSIWDAVNGSLHFNIKWSTSAKERERISRFLRQAGFMTLAELAANGISPDDVSWRYSYPLAMSSGDSADFQNIARKVVSQLRDPGEDSPNVALSKETVGFCSESTAAAVWFRRNQRFTTTSQIVMDIGGGTTDLALWADDGPVWSDSFRIAGKNLIVEFLARNRDFLNSLGVLETILQSTVYRSKFLETGIDQEKFADAVGVIVNSTQFADALKTKFSVIAGSPAGKKLQCGAYLFLGGLLYYVGLQVKALLAKSDRDLLHTEHMRSLSVCFAGRGSTLFTLLNERRQGPDSYLSKCLKLFTAGIQDPGLPTDKLNAEAYFSPRPKHEVSEGMLYWDLITRSNPKQTFSVLGEVIEGELLDGTKKSFDPWAPEESVRQLKRIEPPLVAEFDKFLEKLAELTGVKITLSRTVVAHLEACVASELRKKMNPPPQSHEDPDPPFIVMLRETLLQLYAGAEGDAAVTAELQ